MKIWTVAAMLALPMTLCGCATIVEGRSQDIYVNLTPEGGDCVAWRKGRPIGSYDHVTHIMHVSKSRDDMQVTCKAAGYLDKTANFSSSASAWGVAGALTLDLGLVDYTTGALNKYDATITMVLEKRQA